MNVDYEFNPHREDDMITTVEGLEQFYLLIPDHVKFVYFVFFMLHSSKHLMSIINVVEKEEEDKLDIMSKKSAIIFCNTCKIVQLLSELLRVFHVSTFH